MQQHISIWRCSLNFKVEKYNVRHSCVGVELGYVFTRVPNPKRNQDKPQKRKAVNFDIN